MRLTDVPLDRPVATLMVLVCVTVLGAVALFYLPLGFMPVVQEPEVDINVPYPGSHPLEGLRQVVRPIEEEVAAIPGVKGIFGFSRPGFAVIEAQFEWAADIDLKKMEVRDAVVVVILQFPDVRRRRDVQRAVVKRASHRKGHPVGEYRRSIKSAVPIGVGQLKDRIGQFLFQLIVGHVVQQHDVSASLEGLIQLFQVLYLYFYGHLRMELSGAGYRGIYGASGNNVIFLNEHAVVEAFAVVHSTATGHGVLLCETQTGQRLTGVEHPRPGTFQLPRVLPRRSGGSRQRL